MRTEGQWAHKNSGDRRTVGTEEQLAQRDSRYREHGPLEGQSLLLSITFPQLLVSTLHIVGL